MAQQIKELAVKSAGPSSILRIHIGKEDTKLTKLSSLPIIPVTTIAEKEIAEGVLFTTEKNKHLEINLTNKVKDLNDLPCLRV